ncbi:MAG UNVERIFIED_CONTAM: nicotinamide-nucleotide amidohydrolase family protein [Anaerolineae bacterium]|jgi:nicotinamide-nucleotide amidase
MIEQRLAQKLLQHSLTICLAESCTGGLIAKRLTDQAGSSAYVVGGVVAYANSVKEQVLGISHHTLETYGAVSAETALEMAEGARRLLGADIALSITGIASYPAGITR